MATNTAHSVAFALLPRPRKEPVILERRTAAIQMICDEKGRLQLGLFTHLQPGTTVEFHGPGFNSRTVQVRSAGSYYLLLRRSTAADR